MRNVEERRAVDMILHDLSMGRRRYYSIPNDATVPDQVIEGIVSATFEHLRERAEDRAMKALESHMPEVFKVVYYNDPQFHAAINLFVTIVSQATLGDLGLTREEQDERNRATVALIGKLAQSAPGLVEMLGGEVL